ncbi:hypothetical protein E2C01_058369 [Portunus trituberculatus]|uniref:Uncharacterized protein n=1 Tax=Portunus trituberculatus TaxID=210409 RepID=A0A5B7H4I6_PORTR|nr:hypothetical protein [Portunus trituberculatus]
MWWDSNLPTHERLPDPALTTLSTTPPPPAKKEKRKSFEKVEEEYETRPVGKLHKKRNEYVRIRKVEQNNHDRNIVDKCKDQPKLFYKYRRKLKNKEDISRIKVGDDMIDDTKEMAKVFNRSFQSVFTEEDDFKRETLRTGNESALKEIVVTVEEVRLEGFDVRKAVSPDDVSNWILKGCSPQLVQVLHDLINTTLLKGRVPKD